ncbi:hypothetical protein OHC33_007047 [Knufia fluminis]|uniref:Pyroglutamyl-peptidase 1 n=1 Tax=Knufia fluminis TaxID=191047 RepID=A0AAN8I6L0_9EURO|nr:hypothetical protein OHC33_007047 [Knufia fluminis]
MGDAGPPTPLPEEQIPIPTAAEEPIREIHVLVTGFGPFKSFTINPSWLIASSLPTELPPLPPPEPKDPTAEPTQAIPAHPHYPYSSLRTTQTQTQQNPHPQPLRPPNTQPYKIILHTHPDPIRVAYTPTATLIPSLLNPATNPERLNYDYIFHIGLASGRDSYTLETIGHRQDYIIPDVDDGVGGLISSIWAREDVPEVLHVGWNPQDVLSRWEGEVKRRQDDTITHRDKDMHPQAQTQPQSQPHIGPFRQSATEQRTTGTGNTREWIASRGMLLRPATAAMSHMPGAHSAPRQPQPKKAVVKLSRDAGHFLCEFILMCSLVQRYLEAQPQPQPQSTSISGSTSASTSHREAQEELGKVAFLHVPNGIDRADVERGVMVAESAIRSLVSSWEGGCRNGVVYSAVDAVADGTATGEEVTKEKGAVGVDVPAGGFENKGTGDAIPS